MKRALIPQIPAVGKSAVIPEDEARHLIQVFRMRIGDPFEVIDGNGHRAKAILKKSDRGQDHWIAEIISIEAESSHSFPLTTPLELWMGILKGDAMEWVIEKATELGVLTFVPIETKFTVVQTKGKGPQAFQERWQKISDQALKQCARAFRMDVRAPIKIEEALQNLNQSQGIKTFWCDETVASNSSFHLSRMLEKAKATEKNILIIGPEGGFHPDENTMLSRLTTRVSLGSLILRAETAALLGIGIIHGFYGKNAS